MLLYRPEDRRIANNNYDHLVEKVPCVCGVAGFAEHGSRRSQKSQDIKPTCTLVPAICRALTTDVVDAILAHALNRGSCNLMKSLDCWLFLTKSTGSVGTQVRKHSSIFPNLLESNKIEWRNKELMLRQTDIREE